MGRAPAPTTPTSRSPRGGVVSKLHCTALDCEPSLHCLVQMARVTRAARSAARRVLARIMRGRARGSRRSRTPGHSPPRRFREEEARPETPPPPYVGPPAPVTPQQEGGGGGHQGRHTLATSTPRPGFAWRRMRPATPGMSPVVRTRTPAPSTRPPARRQRTPGQDAAAAAPPGLPPPLTPTPAPVGILGRHAALH